MTCGLVVPVLECALDRLGRDRHALAGAGTRVPGAGLRVWMHDQQPVRHGLPARAVLYYRRRATVLAREHSRDRSSRFRLILALSRRPVIGGPSCKVPVAERVAILARDLQPAGVD